MLLIAPGTPGQRVEDDGVDVAAVIEAGVEVQGQVVRVVADVDGEAGGGAITTFCSGHGTEGECGSADTSVDTLVQPVEVSLVFGPPHVSSAEGASEPCVHNSPGAAIAGLYLDLQLLPLPE